ncbi:MAG: glycosyltransferase family 2 protein [Anaerolineae bacterium]
MGRLVERTTRQAGHCPSPVVPRLIYRHIRFVPARVDSIVNLPRISVVMPVYNGGSYLAAAVESILQQTYRDFELIALDDGSTDGSSTLLDEYAQRDPRIRVIHQTNRGLVPTLNHGLELATGEYIARMDADDISAPTRFEKQVAYLDSHPDVGVVGTWLTVIDKLGTPLYVMKMPVTNASIRWSLLKNNCIGHSTAMMRQSLFRTIGGYDKAALHAEDYDLWLRAAQEVHLANLAETLLMYRQWPMSISSANNEIQNYTADRLRFEAARPFFVQPPLRSIVELFTKCFGRMNPEYPASEDAMVDLADYVHSLFNAFSGSVPASRIETRYIRDDTARMMLMLARASVSRWPVTFVRLIIRSFLISPAIIPKLAWRRADRTMQKRSLGPTR